MKRRDVFGIVAISLVLLLAVTYDLYPQVTGTMIQLVRLLGTGSTDVLAKAEDAAHTSGDAGIMALCVRNDAGGVLAGASGDYIPCTTDASGRMRTFGTSSTSFAEDSAHVSGDSGEFVLAVRNDTHTTALTSTDGDYSPIAVDSTGKIGIRGTFAEDAAHTSADLGLQVLAVRQDTPGALAGTSGDYIPLMTNATGGLVVATAPQTAQCKTITVNAQGVANAGVVVDATAGGVAVLAASTTRCGATVYNLQGGGDILCAPTGLVPTTTVGFYLAAGQSLRLGLEGQQGMKCIRQAGVSATVYVAEETS